MEREKEANADLVGPCFDIQPCGDPLGTRYVGKAYQKEFRNQKFEDTQ